MQLRLCAYYIFHNFLCYHYYYMDAIVVKKNYLDYRDR